MNSMKSSLSNRTTRTLVFPAYEKLYERDPRVAKNLEGHIKALVEEGMKGASFENQEVSRFRARATVIAATTDSFRDENWTRWDKDGFTRRFLWGLIRLEDPDILTRCVLNWERAEISKDAFPMMLPMDRTIPMSLSKTEREKLYMFVRHQPKPNTFAFELLCRMAAVLRWHYKKLSIKKDAIQTIAEFSQCLSKQGADVVI